MIVCFRDALRPPSRRNSQSFLRVAKSVEPVRIVARRTHARFCAETIVAAAAHNCGRLFKMQKLFAAPLPIGVHSRRVETREGDPPSDDSDCAHTNSRGSTYRSKFCPECGTKLDSDEVKK
jgi:hypothetical protein